MKASWDFGPWLGRRAVVPSSLLGPFSGLKYHWDWSEDSFAPALTYKHIGWVPLRAVFTFMSGILESGAAKPLPIRDYFPFRESIRSAQGRALGAIEWAHENGKKFVLLELPTGTGKSAVAIAAAQWASSWGTGAYILSPQKALTAQYIRDFEHLGLVELRGRASYSCNDFGTNCEAGASLRGRDSSLCLRCPYKAAKDEFVSRKMGVTNFDYFLAETLYSGQLPKRSLLVLDEAHNLEQKLLGFTDFEISPFSLHKYSVAIPSIEDGDTSAAMEWIEERMIPAVDSFVSEIPEEDVERSDDRLKAANLLRRMRRFVAGNQAEWEFWGDKKSFVFRPLSAAKYAGDFLFSRAEMVVIMSATILDFSAFCRAVGIDKKDCESVTVPSDFPVSNRPIFYRPLGSMNFRNKSETLPKVADALDKLLRSRPDRKGLIHTNSYEMNSILTRALIAAGHGSRIVTHGPGGAESAIERHFLSSVPTVLCSPSMTEGLDLRDDLSRFQVIVKVPYPPFKDPYVTARRLLDKAWYPWQTAMRLIQATGRSIRSETDFAETYIVDSDFGEFRRINRALLPGWWLAAVTDVAERRPVGAARSDSEEQQRRLL
jgi:ATP-dependent DNA helicase DinG